MLTCRRAFQAQATVVVALSTQRKRVPTGKAPPDAGRDVTGNITPGPKPAGRAGNGNGVSSNTMIVGKAINGIARQLLIPAGIEYA